MSEKSLNIRVSNYTKLLSNGEIQTTYQRLVTVVQNLRTEFSKQYRAEYAVAKVLHGYLDYTYFYLQNDYLKSHKLKLSIVLNHQQASFELWLLGQTKDVQEEYWQRLKKLAWVDEETMPIYSIAELNLLDNPDFDDLEALFNSIHKQFEVRSREIFAALKAHE